MPGAGWIGLDPTSGLFAGEGHIPLACTPEPSSAAPDHRRRPSRARSPSSSPTPSRRVHEDPRVTLPYTDDAVGARSTRSGEPVDDGLAAGDVRLTDGRRADVRLGRRHGVGGVDDRRRRRRQAATRRGTLAGAWLDALRARRRLLHARPGQVVPGRAAAPLADRRRAGAPTATPLWRDRVAARRPVDDPATRRRRRRGAGARSRPGSASPADRCPPPTRTRSHRLRRGAAARRRPARDDVDPPDPTAAGDARRRSSTSTRARRAGRLGAPAAPTAPATAGGRPPSGRCAAAASSSSPATRRWACACRSPRSPGSRPAAPTPTARRSPRGASSAHAPSRHAVAGRAWCRAEDVPPTALCVEAARRAPARLPAAARRTSSTPSSCSPSSRPRPPASAGRSSLEGYLPPRRPPPGRLVVTPDPGVIEVNVHPAALVGGAGRHHRPASTTRPAPAASAPRRSTSTARHAGTGGGNHLTLGGPTPADSPLLRRPDLLRSLITYWQHHPSLSYLFSGRFIGPTSQAPRVDEGRHEPLVRARDRVRRAGPPRPTRSAAVAGRPAAPPPARRRHRQHAPGRVLHRQAVQPRHRARPARPARAARRSRCRRTRGWRSCRRCSCGRSSPASGTSPYAAPLVRWGTELHDRFLLPRYVAGRHRRGGRRPAPRTASPFELGVARRRSSSSASPASARSTSPASRIELRGRHRAVARARRGGHRHRRPPATSTRRSSGSRCRSTASTAGRHVVTCNGAPVPLRPTGAPGTSVAGVRYRAWQPPSALHPTIGVHSPARLRPRRPLERPLARRLHLPRGPPRRPGLRPLPGQRQRGRGPPGQPLRRPRPHARARSTWRRHRRPATAPRAGEYPRTLDLRRAASAALTATRRMTITPHRTDPARDRLLDAYDRARATTRCSTADGRVRGALGATSAARSTSSASTSCSTAGARGRPPARRRRRHLQRLRRRRPTAPTAAGRSTPCRCCSAATSGPAIERAVVQRAELLNLVLTDLYGPRDLLRRRAAARPSSCSPTPASSAQCDRVRLPGSQQLFTTAVDLARDADGSCVVLADRTQAPSGAGYALENRVVVSRVFPSLYRDAQVHRLAPFFRTLRAALQAVAPPAADDPRIVVLTPGPSQRDRLRARLPRLATSATRWCEGGRPDRARRPGVAALARPPRAGRRDPAPRRRRGSATRSSCAPTRSSACPAWSRRPGSAPCRSSTPLGSGVLENPGLLPFLPGLAEHLLGHDAAPAVGADVVVRRRRRPRATCSPTSTSSSSSRSPRGVGPTPRLRLGARAPPSATTCARRIEARPAPWVGQEHVDAGVRADARPTAASRPGAPCCAPSPSPATTRTRRCPAASPGWRRRATAPSISNQAGALSKDTWVLASEPETLTGFWLQAGPGRSSADRARRRRCRPGPPRTCSGSGATPSGPRTSPGCCASSHDRRNDFQHSANPAGHRVPRRCCSSALTDVTDHVPRLRRRRTRPTGSPRPAPSCVALVVDEHRARHAGLRRAPPARRRPRRARPAVDRHLAGGRQPRPRPPRLAPCDRPRGDRRGARSGQVHAEPARPRRPRRREHGARPGLAVHGRRPAHRAGAAARRAAAGDRHRSSAAPPTDSLLLESVLIAAESIITYRRRYRSHAQLETHARPAAARRRQPPVARLPGRPARRGRAPRCRRTEPGRRLSEPERLRARDVDRACAWPTPPPLAARRRRRAARRASTPSSTRIIGARSSAAADADRRRRTSPTCRTAAHAGPAAEPVTSTLPGHATAPSTATSPRCRRATASCTCCPATCPGRRAGRRRSRIDPAPARPPGAHRLLRQPDRRTSPSSSRTRGSRSRPTSVVDVDAPAGDGRRCSATSRGRRSRDRLRLEPRRRPARGAAVPARLAAGRGVARARRTTPRRRSRRAAARRRAAPTSTHRIHADFALRARARPRCSTTARRAARAPPGRVPGLRPPRHRLPAIARPGRPLRERLPRDRPAARAAPGCSAPTCPTPGRRCSCPAAAGSTSTRPTTSSSNDRYVTTAWGRDYGDVPPLKGVIYTEGKSTSSR